MIRALTIATAYFLALFALGFALGTVRVMFVTPRLGPLTATFAEAPIMLIAAFFFCRWVVHRWRAPRAIAMRWAMVLWFLVLLFAFESLLGAMLFGRTVAEQWAAVATPAGLVGLSTQLLAALFPAFIGRVATLPRVRRP